MDFVEIAGGPLNLRKIQARSLILECEDYPIHSHFRREIDNQSETLAYTRQNRAVLPEMIA